LLRVLKQSIWIPKANFIYTFSFVVWPQNSYP
jgi:hypothetical protein